MKNWKQYCFFGIVAFFALSFTFTACDGGNGEPTTYTVTFDSDGGTAVSTQTVTEGNRAVKPSPDPTKDGFDFVHWFNSADNVEWDFDTAITANINLKAKWTAIINSFTVTFDADNGSPNNTQIVIEGEKASKPTVDPIKDGYSFVHWFNTVTGTEWNFDTAITADITLKAQWADVCEHDAAEYYHISDTDCEDPNCNILPQNIYYGSLVMNILRVNIFKAADVTVEQTHDAIVKIQEAYDGMDPGQQHNFVANPPSRIVVIDGPNIAYTWSNDRVFGISHAASAAIVRLRLNSIANGSLAVTEDQPVYAQALAKNTSRSAATNNGLVFLPQAFNTRERG